MWYWICLVGVVVVGVVYLAEFWSAVEKEQKRIDDQS